MLPSDSDGEDEMIEFGRKAIEVSELVQQDEAEQAVGLSAAEIEAYKPKIINREWIVSETDIDWIAIGCYILGTGGGGSPYSHMLRLREVCGSPEFKSFSGVSRPSSRYVGV